MLKGTKNVIAVLLALTLICQTFWSYPLSEVQAKEDVSASGEVYTAVPSDSEDSLENDNEIQNSNDKQEEIEKEQQKQAESEKVEKEKRDAQKEQDLKQQTEQKETASETETEDLKEESNAKAEAEERYSGIDDTAPVVTGVTINDETTVNAEIGTFEEISVGVHYKEEDSGLLSLRVEFYNESTDDYESFYVNTDDIDPNDYKGEGIIWVRQKAFRNLNDTYKLVSVQLSDAAGYNSFYYADDRNQMINDDGDSFAQASYTVIRESELDIVQIQSMKIVDSNGDPADNMNVTAGDELYLEVEFLNNTDKRVSISSNAYWENAEDWNNRWNDDNIQIAPRNTGVIKICLPGSKYDNVDEWTMNDLDYYIYDMNGNEIASAYFYPETKRQEGRYQYNESDQTFYLPWDIFGYNGEADYKITNAPYADDTAPSIKGVTVNDETTISGSAGTYGDVEIWVEYQEDKPGIDEMSVVFETESGKKERFSLSIGEDEESKYTGTGTIQLKSKIFRELNKTYKLTYISVSDFAGNYTYYSADENGNMVSSDGEETFVQASYKVDKEVDPDLVLISSMEIVDANGKSVDASNVSAGDALYLKVVLDNNTKDNIFVETTGYWKNEQLERRGHSDKRRNINANSQGIVLMEIPTSKYDSLGKWQLWDLDYFIYDTNGNQTAYAYFYPELSDNSQQYDYSYYFEESDDILNIPENLIAYSGEGDYAITEAPHADPDAPVIKGITVNSDTETSAEIGTFDEMIFQVNYEELASGIKEISLVFDSDFGETIWASLYDNDTSEEQYVSDDGIITLSIKGFYKLNDNYRLTGVSVSDYAGNSAYYYAGPGGQMVSDDHENTFSQVTVSVTQEKEASLVLIKSMRLVDASGKDVDNSNVSTDQKLYLEVTYQNNTETDVRVSTNADWKSGEKDRWGYGDGSTTIPAGQSNTAVVETAISRYDSTGEWILYEVDYYMYDLDGNDLGYGFYYPDSSIGRNQYDYSDNKNYFSIPMDLVDYNGEGNYIITHAPYPDEKAPVISSVTIKNSNDPLKAEIGTLDDVQLEVQYTEEVSGIENLELRFRNNEGLVETYLVYYSEEGGHTGADAILALNKKALRKLDNTYALEYVSVTDHAGNSTTYYAENGLLIPDGGSEEDGFAQPSYSAVRETETNMLLAEGVRLEKPDGTAVDKSDISAGESLILVIEMDNTLDKDCSVEFYARWRNQNYNGFGANGTAGVPQSDNKKIEIRIPFEVSRFCSVSNYMFDSLNYSIYDSNDNYVGGASYGAYDNQYYLSNESVNIPELSDTSEADFRVNVSDTPDEEAPYIKSVKVVTDSVNAPGTVALELTADTGYAKLTWAQFRIKDVTEPQNNYYFMASDLYYSPQRGCYVATVDLDETVLAGTYQLSEISLQDEAENYRYYNSSSNDKLTDGNGNSCIADPIVIADAVETDRDFASPEVQSIQMDKNSVSVPGEVKYTVKATDDSGLSKIVLNYESGDGENLYIAVPVTKTGENTWSGTAELSAYTVPGEYHADSVYVYDDSIRMNSTFLTDEIDDLEHCSLNITRAESGTIFISGTENEMKAQLQNAEMGAEVVYVSGSFAEAERIPVSVLQIIQDKKLKLTVTSINADTQILVDGADLTDEMTASPFYLDLDVYGFNKQNKIEFVNGYDSFVQRIGIYRPTGNAIPFVARWKLEQPMVEKALEQGNARMSDYSETGSYEIIKENLKITEDGYLELSSEDLPDGSGEYPISTGTVKYFDYPLTVTAVPEISSDTINRGTSFDVQLSVTNNNKTALNDVAVFAMLGMEDQCEWYTFESDDERVDIAGGDAVISSLGSGETVKLKAKFNVPKETEVERAIITFVASSIGDSEDEIISYGEDDLKLVLLDEETAVKGDMNLDGVVNSADLAYMLQYVNKRLSEDQVTKEQLQAGDVSRTDGQAIGTVNSSDLAKLLQFINHRIESLD